MKNPVLVKIEGMTNDEVNWFYDNFKLKFEGYSQEEFEELTRSQTITHKLMGIGLVVGAGSIIVKKAKNRMGG